MRYLVITDVHANAVALDAVLRTKEALSCERVISLGDQVNFGPQPREVLRTLADRNALMLLGNHEERFAHLHEPSFGGYNWRSLHWTRRQTGRLDPAAFPTDVRIGCVLCTHGTPGSPYHLIESDGVPEQLERLPEGVRVLLSGHNHKSWRVEAGDRLAVNPGSLGLWEENAGGRAPFLVADVQGDRAEISRYTVSFDVDEVERQFLQSGLAQAAPEMSRAVLQTLRRGTFMAVANLVRGVQRHAVECGGSIGDEEIWKAVDRVWPWEEAVTSEEFWHQRRRRWHG
ncbi:MAG: metallophosphoesterase family protein [bacterium]|nr:metallophosphoesterase family protein [bacterium]